MMSNAKKLVDRLIEADPDEVSAKSEFMRLPGWRERIIRAEDYEFLSDRWGTELEDDKVATGGIPPEEKAAIERLQTCLGDYENNFIVQRKSDKKYGILFETEFINPDSEEYRKDSENTGVAPMQTSDEVARDLLHVISKLEPRFPQAEFSVSVGEHVFNNRFVIRAFVPEGVITPQLGQELSHIFSGL